MSIEFIRTLRHRVVLEGIFSQAGVEVAGVYVEEECSLPRDCGKLGSRVNEIEEDPLVVDVLTVEYYSTWSRTANRCRRSNLIVTSLALVRVNVCREVSFAVSQGYIGFVLSFSQVQWFVKVLVDEMVLRTLFAIDVSTRRHAN